MCTRILIVDDHPMVRERLRELIRKERDFELCGEAQEAGPVLGLVAKLHAQVVLLDLNLQGVLGIDLIRDIKTQHPQVLILVVSMHTERIFIERALRAGASGYVSKEEPSATVVSAIRKVLGGGIYLPPGQSEQFAADYMQGRNASTKTGLELLSDRELEVLALIGRGETTRQISEKLHIDASTVDTYRGRIKGKLKLSSANELMVRAIEWVQSGQAR